MEKLKELVVTLALAREQSAVLSAKLNDLEARIAESEAGILRAELRNKISEYKEISGRITFQLRAAAIETYTETENKTPAAGVSIRNIKDLIITDEEALLEWAERHLPQVIKKRLDIKLLKRAAGVFDEIPGLEVESEIWATIAKNLEYDSEDVDRCSKCQSLVPATIAECPFCGLDYPCAIPF